MGFAAPDWTALPSGRSAVRNQYTQKWYDPTVRRELSAVPLSIPYTLRIADSHSHSSNTFL